MRAVITGAGGFVGRHLSAHLAGAGDEVVGLDVRGADPIDITDREAVVARIARVRPDVIYHLAARSHVGESWGDDAGVHRVNVEGAANVLAAATAAGVHRVVTIGSSEQYGHVEQHDLPLRESVPLRPVSPYARSKVAAEALAMAAFREHGLGTIGVRAFSHTGPGQSPRFLVPALALRVATAERDGTDEVAVGNLAPMRDFSDARDVVRAYRLLARLGKPGSIYNVCSGDAVSVGDIATRLLGLATRPLRLVVDPELVRDTDVPVLVGSADRLVRATGWRPEISLGRTLRDVLDDVRAQLT